ncbi:pentatricopeptide repeat-containing protein at1g07740 mitochondrial [Phtheirospermum japonicum]|uniref:Pentatricopeptide repeat-containing protein at1g07740 mitochondrial n=1 Tax=Phtheirospermum japonicum TaxID=374723 RepID=A0A830C0Z2_9LAMI|nr:pentatricopeptide repeat-containing protein at1g07740 mitochondrial [Phtheirospermum japonicum]
MLNSRFNSIRALTETPRLNQLNRRIRCNHTHTDLHKKPRPHKPTRNQLRPPIPFLNHLKSCRNPDEFLSIFREFSETGFKHDYPSYASLVYKLARARKFDDVETVLDFLRAHDIRCDEALFIGLIRHYGKSRLTDKAVEVFREMGKSFNCVRTIQSFNTILNVLVDNERFSDAFELFEKGRKMGFRLNSVSYNIMIKSWLENGKWENARKVFDEMLEREVEPTVVTYNSQIGYLCKKGDVDGAKNLFDDMRSKGRQGNAVTYALLMEGLCGSGRFNEAKKLMFDMEYHGCKADLVNYGVLMTDLVKRGSIDEARNLLAEMKKRRIKPDVVMYNILVSYYCKEGDAMDAYKILVDMQVKGCKPNAATYRMVVDCFCKNEDFSGGLKVLNAMLHSNHCPRVETFGDLVMGLFRSGKLDDACFVLVEMNKRKMGLETGSWDILVREVCADGDFVDGHLADVICSS